MNMYILSIITSLLFSLGTSFNSESVAAFSSDGDRSLEDLIGNWQIDLRPTPDAAPYYQQLEITKIEDGRLFGTFYYSPIQFGKVNNDWGRPVIAFVTQDPGGNDYYTVLEVDGYSISGTTHSPQRNFLAVWTGKKKIAE